MDFARDSELIGDYSQWVAERKVVGLDTSPTAFLVDRAKQSAFDKLEKIDKYVKPLWTEDDEGHGIYAIEANVKRTILKIINGED